MSTNPPVPEPGSVRLSSPAGVVDVAAAFENAAASTRVATPRVIAFPTAFSSSTLASSIDSFERLSAFPTLRGVRTRMSASPPSDGIGVSSATHAAAGLTFNRGMWTTRASVVVRLAPERRSALWSVSASIKVAENCSAPHTVDMTGGVGTVPPNFEVNVCRDNPVNGGARLALPCGESTCRSIDP